MIPTDKKHQNRTYQLKTPIEIKFLEDINGAMFGSELYVLEQISRFWSFFKNPHYRNALYILYSLKVNYRTNLMRSLKICSETSLHIINDLRKANIITKVENQSYNEDVKAFLIHLSTDRAVEKISSVTFFELTDWAKEFIERNIEFFQNNISQEAYEEVKGFQESLEKQLSEINQKKAELEEKRAIALAEPLLTDGEIIWFENFGAEFVSDKSNRKKLCKEYNRKFNTELTTGDSFGTLENFDTKVKAYLQTKGIELFDEEYFEIINPKKIEV